MGLGFRDKDVIEWNDSTTNTIVYRWPADPKGIFNKSSLTVRESQIALFVRKGELSEVFEPGMYRLDTDTHPVVKQLQQIWFKGQNRWQADIYFVNTKRFTNQKWGTTNPITLRDQEFGNVRIRGYGVFSFRVNNGRTFLKELFGTNSRFTTEDISNYLKSNLVSGITDTIAKSRVSALDLAGNLTEFNQLCMNGMQAKFNELGLELVNFVVENISFPPEIEKALDKRTELGILGGHMDVYAKKAAADALGDAAKNTGTVGTMMGIGVGQGFGSMMGGMMGSAAFGQQPQQPQQPQPASGGKGKFCSECGARVDENAKFCPECGARRG